MSVYLYVSMFFMNKQNLNNSELEKQVNAKYAKYDKRKKKTMAVSGSSVKTLQKIISKKVCAK